MERMYIFMNDKRISFASDYLEGAHPAILQKLMETNMLQTAGYGFDEFSEAARAKIREACEAPAADIFFLIGGTQTNATVIDAILHSYEGVVAADTGHVSVHEAGAIEFGGHKVLPIAHENGKLTASAIDAYVRAFYADGNHDHMVAPGMVYLSQPTEYGTLYSLAELTAISNVCHEHHLPLYLDGARLAYALACGANDVTLPDIAKLCDAFYIGGTKCGALFGEAVVFPQHDFIPHFFTITKQHGALLAKGRIAGIQFDTLFTDRLYWKIGQNAIDAADKIRSVLREKGYPFALENPTNQIFIVLTKEKCEELAKEVELGFWENIDAEHTVMRIATSWATTEEHVNRLLKLLS